MSEILLVTRPITPPWDEGSKNIAWNIASRASKHRFQLLTSNQTGLPGDLENIKLRKIYTSKDLNFKQQFRLLWFLTPKPLPSVDIFHSIFVPTPVKSGIVSLISRIKNKRYIQTVPSLNHHFTLKEAKNVFFSDHIIALSDRTAEKLVAIGIKHISRINVGIDSEKFSPIEDKNTNRSKFGLQQNVTLALYSGELSRLGSLSMMLSIVQRVLKNSKELHFVFASPTRLPEDSIARQRAFLEIKALDLSDRVHFLGDVSDFSELLRISDMLVYPVSTMTGKIDTPLTILEAMAAELPLIISDLPPLDEVFHRTAGIAVPPDNMVEFADAIIELAGDPIQRREMGRCGREIVKEHFNINTMVDSYERLYSKFN